MGLNLVQNERQSTAEYRMNICKQCPLYMETMHGPKCNSCLYLNPHTGEVSETAKKGFQRGCGCLLNNKTKLQHSHCIVNKW